MQYTDIPCAYANPKVNAAEMSLIMTGVLIPFLVVA